MAILTLLSLTLGTVNKVRYSAHYYTKLYGKEIIEKVKKKVTSPLTLISKFSKRKLSRPNLVCSFRVELWAYFGCCVCS